MKWFSKEVRIALVAIVGVVLLFFGMNFLKGLKAWSSDSVYYITFKDVSGLSVSSPIYADGYKVGVVTGINFDYNQIEPTRVAVELDKDLRVPKGSTAEISSDMLGNVQVNLLLANNPRERVLPGEVIEGMVASGLMDKAAGMIPAVERILPKLDSIMASLNTLLADPALAHSVHNVQTITDNLTVTTAELNKLMSGLNHNVPGLMAKADGVMDNTNQLTANLAAVDVPGIVAQVNQTLANVRELTDKLNDKTGTVGLLMSDPGLYNRLNATVSDADSLLVDLKSHPKRYVHFSIFGKKDK